MPRNSKKKPSAKPRSPAAGRRSRPPVIAGGAGKASEAHSSSAPPSAATNMTAKKASGKGSGVEAAALMRAAFVEHYLANGRNATEAAKAAGYSAKTAKSAGSRLLTHVDVSTAIAERTKKVLSKLSLTTDRVINEVARVLFSDIRKCFNEDGSLKPIHELDDDTAAAISSIEVDEIGVEGVVVGRTKKLKVWDKMSAADKAIRILGLAKPDGSAAAGTVIHAQQVVMMSPMEAYQRLLGTAPKPE